jgi:catechol 2,3-dioxygenase-like lactoylglutathione lyase family enzyme
MRPRTVISFAAVFGLGLAVGRGLGPSAAAVAQDPAAANPFARMLHVGILVDDLDKAVARWRDMGFTDIRVSPPSKGVDRLYHGKPIDVTLKQAFIRGTSPMIELLEPVEASPSPWLDYLKEHGEVIHHLAYRVPDTGSELEKFRKLGLHEVAQGKWPEGESHWGTFHYVQDPRGGVVIEFISRIPRR